MQCNCQPQPPSPMLPLSPTIWEEEAASYFLREGLKRKGSFWPSIWLLTLPSWGPVFWPWPFSFGLDGAQAGAEASDKPGLFDRHPPLGPSVSRAHSLLEGLIHPTVGGLAGRLHPRSLGCFCRIRLVEEKMRGQPVRPGGHLGQFNVGLAGGKASGTTKPGAILLKADLDDGKGS